MVDGRAAFRQCTRVSRICNGAGTDGCTVELRIDLSLELDRDPVTRSELSLVQLEQGSRVFLQCRVRHFAQEVCAVVKSRIDRSCL